MAKKASTPAKIISAFVILFGVIHFGVGVGIVAKYRKYQDVWQQSVALSAFNIIIGILAFVTGIMSLFSIIQNRPALNKIAEIMAGILAVFTIGSFIAALALNSQAVTFVRNRLAFHVNTYAQIDGSNVVMDQIQTNYQCCGENTWLDWASVQLGGTGTGTNINTGTNIGRRRRHSYVEPSYSPLVKAIRQKRQTTYTSNTYGLPTGYTVPLPLSCCQNGGSSSGNTAGTTCNYNGGNSSISFYVEGCVVHVANVVVSQLTGIVVINVFLATLSVLVVILNVIMFPDAYINNGPEKPSLGDQVQQEQQQVNNGGYYGNNAYYGNGIYDTQTADYSQNQPQYQTAYMPQYQSQAPPTYVVY